MYRLLRFFLFLLPPELAHRLGLCAVRTLGSSRALCRALRPKPPKGAIDLSVRIGALRLPNPVGLAAGMDKDGVAIDGWFAFGFGSVEIGTVTPRPQGGNPRPRLFRLTREQALINRMGFNNHGVDRAKRHLLRRRLSFPVGVNVGKNRDTPLELAEQDHARCIEELAPHCDYLVLNASSPNTPGLRELQRPEAVQRLLSSAIHSMEKVAARRPLFFKISPDLAPEEVESVVEAAIGGGADGLIIANTTVSRPISHPLASQTGGLSGRPLRSLSTQLVRRAYVLCRGRARIIGVGGVFDADDAYEKICAGASAVQLFTGLIYRGPGLASEILGGLGTRLKADGHASIEEAIGKRA